MRRLYIKTNKKGVKSKISRFTCYLSVYGQLAKLYCCHISMILPFEIRNRSKPVATYGLSVGGLPNNGPVFVPLFVHLISTLSPFAKISSCTSFPSGMAAITAYAYFFAPSGPLRNFSGRTGLCKNNIFIRSYRHNQDPVVVKFY